MSTGNAEEIYERYIKALPFELRLRLVEIVVRELAAQTPQQEKELEEEKEPSRDLMDLHGLGKEIWQGIDAQTYVDHLRSEWDHRP
jgi:hypothetical protein